MTSVREVGLGLLRSDPVNSLARRLTGSSLRIIGYHGVENAAQFEAQMTLLAEHWVPVDETQVADAIHKGSSLPRGAVWVTFDDGDPSVVERGLPVLEHLGVPATMYICPGLIDSGEPFWWRYSEWADEAGIDVGIETDGATITEYVKLVSDDRRRTIIADLATRCPHRPPHWHQLDASDLDAWTAAGMALGNHSWDHPCLDRCEVDEQRSQIRRTHDWLQDRLGNPPRTFAYPNGNFSAVVDAELADLGYDLGLLYDHRLTALDGPPLQLSRLMAHTTDPVEKFASMVSGAAPLLTALTTKIRPGS